MSSQGVAQVSRRSWSVKVVFGGYVFEDFQCPPVLLHLPRSLYRRLKAFLKQHFLTSGLLTELSKQSLSDSTQC